MFGKTLCFQQNREAKNKKKEEEWFEGEATFNKIHSVTTTLSGYKLFSLRMKSEMFYS